MIIKVKGIKDYLFFANEQAIDYHNYFLLYKKNFFFQIEQRKI